jgi:hypothetical protein
MDLNKSYADYYDRTHPPAYKIACNDSRQRFEEYQKDRERKLKQDELTRKMLEKEMKKQEKEEEKEEEKEKKENPQPTLLPNF